MDYRALNKLTIKDRYPLPLISDLIRTLSDGKIFSVLDLRGAYNLLRMKHGDESKMGNDNKEFLKMLNRLRIGQLAEEDNSFILSLNRDIDEPVVKIFATNTNCNEYNSQQLCLLECEEQSWIATDQGVIDSSMTLLPAKLTIKTGAIVMLIANINDGLYNGSVGRVQSYTTDEIIVLFNGQLDPTTISQKTFGVDINKTRNQFPLILAYGITIHKAQGMSISYMEADLDGTFAAGQVYVALSRAKSIKGLIVKNFNPLKVVVDPKVKQFYNSIKN